MTRKKRMSRYDDLLGRYHQIATTKQGIRYEILAAIVCKTLEEKGVVIHDVAVRGESGVKHQIDVTIETAGKKRRCLIECKDFDTRSAKVGLGTVRNFESAVRDTAPDEAWIVTCIGFTRDALKFAKAKGITPVVMRLFEDSDLAGRIVRSVVNMHVPSPGDPVLSLFVGRQRA
jgi:hypothetical protein